MRSAALFNFLQQNGITSMWELHEKVSAMNASYYDLRGEITSAERRLAVLTERLEMSAQYEQHKGTRRQFDGLKPGKHEKFAERHGVELALFDTAARFLGGLKATGEAVTLKQWRAEADTLTTKKDVLYSQMRAMREEKRPCFTGATGNAVPYAARFSSPAPTGPSIARSAPDA